MQYKIERMGIHILAFLVARLELLGLYPFVVPFFMAAYLQGRSSVSIFAALMLGVGTTFNLTAMFKYALVILFLLVLLGTTDRKKYFEDNYQIAIASGVCLTAISLPYQYLVTGKDSSVYYSLLEGIIAGCFVLVFEQGFLMFCNIFRSKKKENRFSQELLIQEATRSRIQNFGQAFLAMEKMLVLHEQDREEQIPNGLSNMYLSGDGISLLNAVESQSNRLTEMRKNFIRQLGQIGEIITSFQAELSEQSVKMELFEGRLAENLDRAGVTVTKAVLVKDKAGRIEVYVSCYRHKDRIITGQMMAEKISALLLKNMVCIRRSDEMVSEDESSFSFVEEGVYMLTTGVVRRNRTGESLCGDNFSVSKLDTQKAVLMLSDGMGSGEAAYVKSEQIVELLEQLLEAGFCRELAIELLNSFISFMTDGSVSTTLDLTMIDFYTGIADFIKLGASTTFIKRKDTVECIRSTSLPVGVLEQIEFDTCARKLYHGDIIVMISDGVLDGIIFENKETYLADLIASIKTNNVQVIAETIMKDVENMQRGKMRDDSTVLVSGIWER